MIETEVENKCPQCGASLPSGVLAGLCPSCQMKSAAPDASAQAARFEPPGIEEISRLFPQLEILSLIGKNGTGAVYQARHPALDRIVALQILPPKLPAGANFVERFNTEARALASLNHSSMVALYEFGQAGGLPYLIMEWP
jgi:serine/threonine protein kinase